jgi:hypothetical protein
MIIAESLTKTHGPKTAVDGQAAIDQARAASSAPVLDPWTGYAVMPAWVAVLLVVAAALLRRRDA